jgi:hypothetical protein
MSTTASVYLNGSTDYLQIFTGQTQTGNSIGGNVAINFFDGYLTANGQIGPTGATGLAGASGTPLKIFTALASASTLPAGTADIIWPLTAVQNTDGYFNSSTNTFTPLIAGNYMCSAVLNITYPYTGIIPPVQNANVQIFKNGNTAGATAGFLQWTPGSGGTMTVAGSVIPMNGTTDSLYLNVNNGGSTVTINIVGGNVSFYLIGGSGPQGATGPAGGGDVYLANANVFTNTNTFQTIVPANNTYTNGTSALPWNSLFALGRACRSGFSGVFSGNSFNINWTGTQAQLYIDNTNIGTVVTQTQNQFATISNSGSAGGQMYYYTNGGIKTCTGTTATIAVPSATGGFSRTIDFPGGYFASIQSFQFSAVTNSSSTDKADIRCSSFPSTAGATMVIYSGVGTNMVVSWTAIGT